MKCIHCGADSKKKDREQNQGRCGSCRHALAFEPASDPLKITDPLFQKMIQEVSGDGTLFFTTRQLWYEFNRKLLRRRFWRAPWGWVAGGSAASGCLGTLALSSL